MYREIISSGGALAYTLSCSGIDADILKHISFVNYRMKGNQHVLKCVLFFIKYRNALIVQINLPLK